MKRIQPVKPVIRILPAIVMLIAFLAALPFTDHYFNERSEKATREIDRCVWKTEKIYLWWSSGDSKPDITAIFPEQINIPVAYTRSNEPLSGPGTGSMTKNEAWIDYNLAVQVSRILMLQKSGAGKNSDEIVSSVAAIQDLLVKKISMLERLRTRLNNGKMWAGISMEALVLLTLLVILLVNGQQYTKPARHLLKQVRMISDGDFVNQFVHTGNDIFGKISENIENVRQHVSDISQFIQRIGEDDFNTSDLNISQSNPLGSSLIQMQKKLKTVAEEDKRRNWVNEGLTRFSEILRRHNDDLKVLSDDMILQLTRYLGVNQGAFYLLREEKGVPALETMATYAWDRKKFVKEKFGLKENLIGQAILEKDIIYMSDVPDGFVHITSGLGKSNPREILIVPLIANDEPQGVIELASFSRFENYMIEFVKHVSENIASTIVGIRTNNQTRRLLQESQEMTKQLKTQEEELRKNTRDLSNAKENLNRQLEEAKLEMQMQIQKIEAEKKKNIAILEGCEDGVITFKNNGIIDFFNKAAEEIFQIPREKALGKHMRAFIPVEIMDSVDDSKVIYVGDGASKTIDSRTELSIFDARGQEISVLTTLSVGRLEEESTFAFFIQRISVELF